MPERANRNPFDTGTDKLAKRERTRLWYRTDHSARNNDWVISERPTGADSMTEEAAGRRRGRTDQLRSIEALQATLDQGQAADNVAAPVEVRNALTDWRDAPRHCPILLLSSNSILDARLPGPLLGPGTKYRIVSVADGIVCLQVETLDGQVGLGYCNAVDLMCYEPEILYLRQKKGGKRQTARLGLARISQRLSGVTGSLIG
jgi:hypothetical protein